MKVEEENLEFREDVEAVIALAFCLMALFLIIVCFLVAVYVS